MGWSERELSSTRLLSDAVPRYESQMLIMIVHKSLRTIIEEMRLAMMSSIPLVSTMTLCSWKPLSRRVTIGFVKTSAICSAAQTTLISSSFGSTVL